MKQMDVSLLIVLIGAGMVLLLCIVNAVITAKRNLPCRILSRITYGIAILAVLFNMVRMVITETPAMVFANVIALVCVIVSLVRSEKMPLQTEANDNSGVTN
ncbi:hypothetical protein V6615_04550 [Oscillospiraceae bacterium PP1C4]